MDTPSAFVGKTQQPTEEEVKKSLGASTDIWKQLVDWLAEQGVSGWEWKSSGAKHGWSLRLKMKKRNIVYLAPCAGCFRVAFVLGNRAMEAARKCGLSKSAIQALDEATRYPEGAGVRLMVRSEGGLDAVKKLALAKLAN
jgi:hypothetical protein